MPDRPAASGKRTVPDRPVDPVAVQASFDRLSSIFAEMMVSVVDNSTRRCPYRDRVDRCTAKFGCRNQRRDPTGGEGRACGGDDRLDHRSVWETG